MRGAAAGEGRPSGDPPSGDPRGEDPPREHPPGEAIGAPLEERVREYLAARYTATLATVTEGEAEARPHAATVFYVLGSGFDLYFLSRPDSRHGRDIGRRGAVAVSVADSHQDWREVQGVQLWGEAVKLEGPGRIRGLARYTARFPFLEEVVRNPRGAAALRAAAVYRFRPVRIALTDNRTGLFGREVLELPGKKQQ